MAGDNDSAGADMGRIYKMKDLKYRAKRQTVTNDGKLFITCWPKPFKANPGETYQDMDSRSAQQAEAEFARCAELAKKLAEMLNNGDL